MKTSRLKRTLAAVLVCAMILGISPVYAAGTDNSSPVTFQELDPEQVTADLISTEQETVDESQLTYYADTDVVRVTIVLEDEPAISTCGLEAASAFAYRTMLKATQDQLAARISSQVLDGEKLDVVWNLTLAENAISANVAYGKLEEIRDLSGVKAVYLETRYEPMTTDVSNVVAQDMTGANAIQSGSGYTGAGIRIAVIDTGTDTNHQSFDEGGYLYSLTRNAEAKGMSVEDYVDSLNLLDEEEIAAVLDQLHVSQRYEGITAQDLYLNEKLPFNFNYVDRNLDVTHDNDTQGEHGSHVAGIATANEYIPTDGAVYDFDGDGNLDADDAQALLDYILTGKAIAREEQADISGNGTVTSYDAHLLLNMVADGTAYVSAEDAVGVTGVAPDAQLLTMKVFGILGGAYSSDYMAAVEDAVILGCTAVNLSLGAPYPGFRSAHESNPADTEFIDSVMEKLTDTGIVMCVAAGNSGNWADQDAAFGYMYTDEAGTDLISSPATYATSLPVASVNTTRPPLNHETIFDGTYEPTVEQTTNGIAKDWDSLDPEGEGTTYDVA